MFVSGSWDNLVKIWQRDSAGTFNYQCTLTVDSPVYSVAFAPSGETMAVGLQDGNVLLVDVATVAVKRSLRGDKQINCVAFSPNGKILAVGDGGLVESGNVLLYDPTTGEVKSTLSGHSNW